jgi:hypothetical protein
MTEHICRRNGMAEAIIYQAGSICIGNAQPRWLEAGVMDENGEWIANKDVHLGIEAYRERITIAASIPQSRSSSFDQSKPLRHCW